MAKSLRYVGKVSKLEHGETRQHSYFVTCDTGTHGADIVISHRKHGIIVVFNMRA